MPDSYFVPERVLFEERALSYPLGQTLWDRFQDEGKSIRVIGSHNRVTGLPGKTVTQKFREAKKTLVVGVRKSIELATCRPSADYQLVFSTSCPGMCEYCYLHTTLGRQPVVRLYVNISEILAEAERVMEKRRPAATVFEGAATSDPLPLEPYSGALAQAIRFFAGREDGRFRFVTKFDHVLPLLNLDHRGKTDFRFSVNTREIIGRYEHGTPSLERRLAAARSVYEAGYPLGFLVAPVFLSPGWQDTYRALFLELRASLPEQTCPSFELVTHRFTARGKANIKAVFPGSTLPLDEESRRYRYGQFGYGKYVYMGTEMHEAELYMTELIRDIFPGGKLLYFV